VLLIRYLQFVDSGRFEFGAFRSDLTELHDRGGGAAVILVSTHSEADFADLIAESPAAGFLSKEDLSAHAIRRIVDGGGPGAPPGARRP